MCSKVLAAALMSLVAMFPAVPAGAQTLKLEFDRGLVSVDARNVSVLEILTHWATIRNVEVENIQSLPSTPVTIELRGVTEQEALSALLRGTLGYVLGSQQPSRQGAAIDRIILAVPTPGAATVATRGTPPEVTVPRDLDRGPVVAPLVIGASARTVNTGEAASPEGDTSVTSGGTLFIPPVPPTPQLSEMPLRASRPEPDTSGSNLPKNALGIKTGSPQAGTIAPVEAPPQPADGIAYRSEPLAHEN